MIITKNLVPVLVIFVVIFSVTNLQSVRAQAEYDFQVGATGDSASVGNIGERVEIRTHAYSVSSPDYAHGFWVGDDLVGGGFIQFGYMLLPQRKECLYYETTTSGEVNCEGAWSYVRDSEPRWFWEYWPNAHSEPFYFGMGSDSIGANDTWHLYSIEPSNSSGWSFVLDGQVVSTFDRVQPTTSVDAAYFVAEAGSLASKPTQTLGPVEFSDLSYLTHEGWNNVSSLTAYTGCAALTVECDASIPYGLTVMAPNIFVAGSGESSVINGVILWRQLFLAISVPLEVHVIIDGVERAGSVRIPVNGGLHKISVPRTLLVTNGTRLIFTGWSDGYTAVNRTTMVTDDTYLSAGYSTQYYLNLTDIYGSAKGAGWYNQGDVAQFSVPSSVPARGLLGMFEVRENFQGWYENGQRVSSLPSSSVIMNVPHSLSTQWAVANNSFLLVYLILATVIIMCGLTAIKLKRRRSSEQVVEAIGFAPVKPKFCRECGAKIIRDSKFCKECGWALD